MITSRKNFVDIPWPKSNNMLELGLNLSLHINSKLAILAIPACEEITSLRQCQGVIPSSSNLGDGLREKILDKFWRAVISIGT